MNNPLKFVLGALALGAALLPVAVAAASAPVPPPPPAADPAAQGEMVGDLYRFPYAEAAPWKIVRYTTDAAGKQTEFCGATEILGEKEALRFVVGPMGANFGFMGYASSDIGTSVPIQMWFGSDRDQSQSIAGFRDADPDGPEWLSVEPEQGATLGEFGANPSVNFAYQVEGKEHIQTFPLAGAHEALAHLASCMKQN